MLNSSSPQIRVRVSNVAMTITIAPWTKASRIQLREEDNLTQPVLQIPLVVPRLSRATILAADERGREIRTLHLYNTLSCLRTAECEHDTFAFSQLVLELMDDFERTRQDH